MSDNNNQEDKKTDYATYGISFGLLGGTIIASILSGFIRNPILWVAPALGMLVGMTIGNIMDVDDDDDDEFS